MAKYSTHIRCDEQDQIFVASAPELAGCMAHGATHEEALANVQEAVDFWLDTARELGRVIPLPSGFRSAVGQ